MLNWRKLLTIDGAILFVLWLVAAIGDRLWFSLDHSIPAWDQSAHLTGALGYWQIWQHPDILAGEWWQQIWQRASSYRGPLVYLATVPFLNLFGRGFDQAALVNLWFMAIILTAVYALGKHLFNRQIGLWAAGLSILMPSLAFNRTDYLLDYGLTAAIALTFLFITWWRDAETRAKSWLSSLGFGLGLGLIMLAKPTGFLFILVPGLWLLISSLVKRRWARLLQFLVALSLTWLVCGGWYRTNWLTIITSALAANAVGAAEGDPGINTLAGWWYYFQILPDMVSWPLLLIALGCTILNLGLVIIGKNSQEKALIPKLVFKNWQWLAAFCLGAYLLCSLGTNKDSRFILPYIPGVALFLAGGLNLSSSIWNRYLRWSAAALAGILLIWQLFPLPGGEKLANRHLPYLGSPWPLPEVIAEVTQTNPYLRTNIGVIPNTVQINPFSIDFYGNLADFRSYGRQLAATEAQVTQDGRSLIWYITKTGDQGPSTGNDKARTALQTFVEQSPELQLVKTWSLPDNSQLSLYRRRQSTLAVEEINQTLAQVKLAVVNLPASVPPGKPVPVTYQFSGNWKELQNGLVLLTWQGETANWFHDRAIGLGQLYSGLSSPATNQSFRVTENAAMLPPANIPAGNYTLQATYLDRRTGASYPLDVESIQIKIDPQATILPAPELDAIAQLHQLSLGFAQGKLDPVFQEVGRLNQYDPLQDYLVQAEQILTHRWQAEPKNLEVAYTLAISQVLQRRVQPVLNTFGKIAQIDANNPYAWTYLGFIHLYNWQPQAAESAFQVAEKLNPNLPELKTLKIVAAAMRLNLVQAWQRLQTTSP